jgi:hypothetical protein
MIVGLWIAFIGLDAKAVLSRHPMLSLTLTGGMMVFLIQVESSPIQYWELLLVIKELLSAFRLLHFYLTKQQHVKSKENKMG